MLMLLRPLQAPAARSFLRNLLDSNKLSKKNKFYFCTTAIVNMADSVSVSSSGFSTPVSGVATPLRNGYPAKGKGAGKPVVKKKEVRILMLHGYTQSGPLFRAKTRALEKLMAKTLAPLNLVPSLVYPTGPNRLRPSDIPGYQPSSDAEGVSAADEETDSWAWFRKDEANGSYRYLKEGMDRLAETIRGVVTGEGQGVDGEEAKVEGEVKADGEAGEKEAAPIDGVIGFSQGGCMAALLASAMETTPGREAALSSATTSPEHQEWARAVREANGGKALKFAVIYSGFYAVPEDLKWLYEPKVETPTLHFLGSLDTVVEEGRSQGLVERCREPVVVVHPGGHYVPVNKEWVMPLVGFIRNCLMGQGQKI